MRSITPSELVELLNAGKAPRLLDVRDPWEYDLCRINGSVNIPMGELMGKLDSMQKNEAIVVICHHGMRSQQVVAYLDGLGFTDSMNLEGGIDAWSLDVDAEMPQY
ncbi:MAG: sulfurtransferase [Gammaproteobacteria bacterium]|nr:sulfurtransferase [Gammaproteobacteria bacterium]